MDSSRKSEVTAGVVLPLIALVVLVVLGLVMDEKAAFIALMAAVPMFAAIFGPLSYTVIVAAASVVAGIVLAAIPGDDDVTFSDMTVPLVGLVVFAAIAVVAARMKPGPTVHAPATAVERRKGVQFQLQTQADTDAMTGLLNRRGAIRALGPRNDGPDRILAFLDCDLFKNVNDQYGTDVGDEFLQAVAGRLRHSLPTHDTVARWDGDEFLVAISSDTASARPALERVVKSVSAHPVRTTVGPVPSAVSVGAAVWVSGQELEDVISRAGRALYAAKSGGRGRVVVDEESGRVASGTDSASDSVPAND